MIPRAQLLLAFSLLCFDSATASPCKPTTTALTSASETGSATSLSTSSDGTVATTDSTTAGSSTDSPAESSTDTTTVSVTITASSTESTTFLSGTTAGPVSSDSTTATVSTAEISTTESFTTESTTFLSVTTTATASSGTTDSTSEALTTGPATESSTTGSQTTQAPTTTTVALPDSTPFNIIARPGSPASGFLRVRNVLGGDVYFNNANPTYQTGEFVVSGRGRLVNRGQFICAYFRTGANSGDLMGCQLDEEDIRLSPLSCQLTASEDLQCTAAGKFCYYQGEFLTCENRGVYSSVYVERAGSEGWSVAMGPSDLTTGINRSPVQLAASPIQS